MYKFNVQSLIIMFYFQRILFYDSFNHDIKDYIKKNSPQQKSNLIDSKSYQSLVFFFLINPSPD